jgi:hypothetical protein
VVELAERHDVSSRLLPLVTYPVLLALQLSCPASYARTDPPCAFELRWAGGDIDANIGDTPIHSLTETQTNQSVWQFDTPMPVYRY